MYLSKYIRRCDFMNNMNTMDFNQKIDVSLRASLEATPVERNASDDLSTGSSSDGFWNLIVLYTGSPQTLQNEFPSSSFTFLLGNYAIVKISEDDIPSLAAFPQVIYIERPRQLFFEIVSARQASCLSAIQENSSYGLTGKGILISVIDSGIDYAHPDFCNPDKTTRLVALWDQTILADPSAGRFAPAGYSQGTLFSPEQINAALQADTFEQRMELVPSTDVTGHGTHVAGIAAGNGRASGGLYRGVAPESSLLAVKLGSPDPKGFPNTIELMQAVDFSVRYALEHTVPLVINLSFGNTYGSHSGTSLLETYLDYVSNLGRINIVVGSGNEGNNGGHASARLASLESARIEFAVGNYESSLSIQIWKNYWDDIRFQLTPPGLGTSFKIPNQPGSWRFSLAPHRFWCTTDFPPLIVCIRKLPSICCRGGTIFREVSGFLPQKHGLSSKELLICGCRRPLSAGLPHNFSHRQRKPLSRYLPPPEMSLPSVPTILPPIRSPLFPAEDIPGIPDRSNRIWSLPVSASPAVLSGAVTNPEAAPPWLLLL